MKLIEKFLDVFVNTNEIQETSDLDIKHEFIMSDENDIDMKVLEILTIMQNNISN